MLPAFRQRPRSDNAVMLASLWLNRRFDYHGFTPRFSFSSPSSTAISRDLQIHPHQFQIGCVVVLNTTFSAILHQSSNT